MINQINTMTSQMHFDAMGKIEAVIPIETRLDRSLAGDQNLDQLYESLKKIWEKNSSVSILDIINQVRNFANTGGEKPYGDISTHTAVIGQVREKLNAESGCETPFYALLNESLGFAIVSNGILNSFLAKMRERPEDPEPW
ncbi:hypothetical protein ACXX82_21760 [Glaciimonas sp. GNP009]